MIYLLKKTVHSCLYCIAKGRHRFLVFAETFECGFHQDTLLEITRVTQRHRAAYLVIIPC